MIYDFIPSFCLSKKAAVEEYKEEWNATRYMVCGKMFAVIHNDSEGIPVISVKNIPEHGIELREKYSEIIPGYHFNKTHWSSVYLNGHLPEEVLRQMIDESYTLVFKKLPLRDQREIMSVSEGCKCFIKKWL